MRILAKESQQNDSTQVTRAASQGYSEVKVSEFLSSFFPNPDEIIHLRAFKPKKAPKLADNSPKTYRITCGKLPYDLALKEVLRADNQTRGLYFVVNAGGNSDEDIMRYTAFFVENDTLPIEQQHVALDDAPLQPSIRVETKQSVHAYWLIEGACKEEEWRDIQARLIAYFEGDKQNCNPSRCMRLPLFNHVTFNGVDDYSYKPVDIVVFEPARRFTVVEMQEAFPQPKKEDKQQPKSESMNQSASVLHFTTWDELNAELKRRIMAHPTAEMQSDGWWHCRGICHNGSGHTAVMFNPATGAVKCMNDCSHEELLRAFGLPEKPLSTSLAIRGRRERDNNMRVSQDKANTLAILIQTPTTDVGNSECMSALYRSTMRYCHTRKAWLLWDGVRWSLDLCGKAQKLTVDMVRARQQAAMEHEDASIRQQIGRWGLSSESISRVDAAIRLAQVIEPFATTIDKFDANPLLATTTNGTLDLQAGAFRQSNPDDYLTMQLGAEFLPDAKAPRWVQFLQEVFGGDEELIQYIQLAVGYSLTGETKEQNLFLCYGSGANGKSVFLEILSSLLGDYAGAASFEAFNAGNRNEAGYDLAVLKGKRVVTVIETNEDRFLDEAKVKAVTGQDLITCRFLHKNFFTYRPQFKIWMAMNHKPVIRGTDNGIWRRIHLVPFTQSFKGREDRNLNAKLSAELPGILNWALEGLRKWQQDGLRKAKAVEDATSEYRRESDSLGLWIEERTTQNPIGQLRAREGYNDYSAWALSRGEKPFGIKNWGSSLIERGYKHSRNNRGVHYFGLELIPQSYR